MVYSISHDVNQPCDEMWMKLSYKLFHALERIKYIEFEFGSKNSFGLIKMFDRKNYVASEIRSKHIIDFFVKLLYTRRKAKNKQTPRWKCSLHLAGYEKPTTGLLDDDIRTIRLCVDISFEVGF